MFVPETRKFTSHCHSGIPAQSPHGNHGNSYVPVKREKSFDKSSEHLSKFNFDDNARVPTTAHGN